MIFLLQNWFRFSFCALVLVAGCNVSVTDPGTPPPLLIDGSVLDSQVLPRVEDSDGDGLCDLTESSYRTDPTLADTDADGISDRVEVDFGFRATRPDDPDREQFVVLEATPFSSVTWPVDVEIRGAGENYQAAFEILAISPDPNDDGWALLETVQSVGATPVENVGAIVPDEARFQAVRGRTALLWNVVFNYGNRDAEPCARAIRWRLLVKREDGRVVAAPRFTLLIKPPSQDFGTLTWCAVDTCR